MIYHILYPYIDEYSILNVVRYITFRTAYASLTALMLSLLLGPWLIARLRQFQIGQYIQAEVLKIITGKSELPPWEVCLS